MSLKRFLIAAGLLVAMSEGASAFPAADLKILSIPTQVVLTDAFQEWKAAWEGVYSGLGISGVNWNFTILGTQTTPTLAKNFSATFTDFGPSVQTFGFAKTASVATYSIPVPAPIAGAGLPLVLVVLGLGLLQTRKAA